MVGALLAVLGDPHAVAIGRLLLDQPGRDLVLALRRHALHQRPVGLLGLACPKRLGELHRRQPRARHDENARRVAVEPMHQPRLLALLVAPGLQHGIDAARDARAALHGEPRRLVEDEHFRVFVQQHLP